ncbi:MAG: phosphoglucosamine mutase [Gemmataceae bacterium]
MASSGPLIVSVSGVRGVVGESLTPQVTLAFASAFADHLNGGPVVVSRDGRPSGAMFRHAAQAGLVAAGCDVHDLGVAATPTVGMAVRTLQAAGGVQITASHNPAPYNGMKLFGPDGRVLSAAVGAEVKRLFERGAARHVRWDELGTVRPYRQAEETHGDRVLQMIDGTRIRGQRFKVVLDGNGGAGGPLGQRLLQSLAVEIVPVHCEPDGVFRHEPEPTAENLAGVCPLVKRHEADVGFALDPDSDRLALIDETGRYIGEELTLALAALARLRRERGPVVVNMSTSRVIEDIATRFGCPCYRSAVGEANVADRMVEVGAVIGGEGNGGVIDPRVGFVRDPFIGMALVLGLMADTGRKLSELVSELPAYTIVKDKYTVDASGLPGLYEALTKRWPEAKADRADGLRLDWSDRWVHVRPSNTEPIVRVIAEAPVAADARGLCADVGKLLG